MTLLILARHGNTFGPSETPVWVGAREDFPLVASGEAQARDLGRALKAAGAVPARILCGPLKRTRRAAEIAASEAGFTGAIGIDDRLKEIDYGAWGGKSDAEVAALWGEAAIAAWRTRGERPGRADWTPDDATLRANAAAVLAEAAEGDGPVLIVTSNGVLRYMHAALGFTGDHKVKTGGVCAARIAEGAVTPLFWNADPAKGPGF